MDRWTNGQTDKRTDGQTDKRKKRTDGKTYRLKNVQTDRRTDIRRERQTTCVSSSILPSAFIFKLLTLSFLHHRFSIFFLLNTFVNVFFCVLIVVGENSYLVFRDNFSRSDGPLFFFFFLPLQNSRKFTTE